MADQISKEERRLIRQKRKKRNRLIAIIVTIVVLAVVGVGGYFGVSTLIKAIGKGSEETTVEEIEETVAEEPEVIEEEPVIEMTPEIIEEPEITPEPEEPEQTDEEIMDEMVRSMIAEMTLEEKVAGIFIVSPEQLTKQDNVQKAGDGTKTALEQYPVGGIIYSKKNFKNKDSVTELIANTSSYSRYPLFIAIREEGGKASELQAALKLDKTSSAKELAAAENSSATFDSYYSIGAYLKEYGFNLDIAPVADILTNPANTSIGDRSFGDDATAVASNVTAGIGGLKEAGITSCISHFPGQGNANGDPNQSMCSTDKTKADMDSCELIPFRAAIDEGVEMIMVGNFAAPELTGDNLPCTFSKAISTELLRDEMGYDGIIITDALNAKCISDYYGADEAAIKAIKSGVDMILLPEDFELAYSGVIEAINEGTIDIRRIDDALARIYKVKYKDTLVRSSEE